MKNIFPAFTIMFIFLVTFTQQSAAQEQDIMSFNLDDDTPDLSKPIIINLPELANTFHPAKDSIAVLNKKAVKDFQKTFKAAANPVWCNAYDGGYVVTFTGGNVTNMVAYSSKGNWHHTIRKYHEEKLPRDIRGAVKSVYYDYAITGVDEVTVDDNLIYLVRIQDDVSIKTIRFFEGEMIEIQSFKRG